MAIDTRQIADISDIAQPQFVMDPLVSGTTPGITMEKKSDGKYHITLTLLQNVIDGSGGSSSGGDGGGSSEPDPDPPPSTTVTAVNPNSLSLVYDPITYDTYSHTITANNIGGFNSTIMKLAGDTVKTNAGTYTVKIYLKDITKYKWSDSRAATASVDFDWTILRANLPTWSIDPTSLTITGSPGSAKNITVTRIGNGKVSATSSNTTVATVTVSNAEGTKPTVTVTDKTEGKSIGNATITVSVEQGDNYYSSAVSHENNSSCPVNATCKVDAVTINKELKECTPAEIVDIVRRGLAPTLFKVGDRIPITTGTFKLGIDYGLGDQYTFDAVVLGFDHNIDKETPTLSHNMALSLMYARNSNQATAYISYRTHVTSLPVSHQSGMKEISNVVYNAMPSEWKNVIVDTTKYNATNTMNLKVFCCSYYEVYGQTGGLISSTEYANNKQQQYTYFKSNSFPSSVKACQDSSVTYDMAVMSRSIYNGIDGTGVFLSDCTSSTQYVTIPDASQLFVVYRHNMFNANPIPAEDMSSYVHRPIGEDILGSDRTNSSRLGVTIIPCFTIG